MQKTSLDTVATHLSRYSRLGIDFDGTLVGHPASHLLREYIRKNPHNQTFYIVTHRSGGMEKTMGEELSRESYLTLDKFASVFSCPHELWQNHTFKIVTDLKNDPYSRWKAEVCSENRIEVMVDDMEKLVRPSCDELRIDFVHPDRFLANR